MARGYIKGFRLGTTSAMDMKCAVASRHMCGYSETGVNIVSVSEHPVTRLSYVYFDLPTGVPNGGYDVFLTTKAGIVSGQYFLGDGVQYLGDATVSGFVTDPSGIPNTFVTITGSNLVNKTEDYVGTRLWIDDIELAFETGDFDPTWNNLATFKIPSHFTLSGVSSKYEDYQSKGLVSYDVKVSNRSGVYHTGDTQYDVIPPPTIYGFSPPSGSSGIQMEVSGANFINVDVISLGGSFDSGNKLVGGATGIISHPQTTISSGLISFETPDLPSKYPFFVFATGGNAKSENDFVYTHTAPTISGFEPARVGRGQVLQISGERLASTDKIEFSGVTGTISESFFFIKNAGLGIIQINVPSKTIDGKLRVVNEGGESLSPNALDIILSPEISGIAKTTAGYEEWNSISGLNLSGSRVLFAGISGMDVDALNLSYDQDNHLSFQTPREIYRGYPLVVSGEDGKLVYSEYDFDPLPTVTGWDSSRPFDDFNYQIDSDRILITGINAFIRNVTHIVVRGEDHKGAGWALSQMTGDTSKFVIHESIYASGLHSYNTGVTVFSGMLPYDTGIGFFGTGKLGLLYNEQFRDINITTRHWSGTEVGPDGNALWDWAVDNFGDGYYASGGYLQLGLWNKDRGTNAPVVRNFMMPSPVITSFTPDYAYGEYDGSSVLQEAASTKIEIVGKVLATSASIRISGYDSYPLTQLSKAGIPDNAGHVFNILDDTSVEFYVPATFSGSGHLVIRGEDGQEAISSGILRNVRPIVISGFTPSRGNEPYDVYSIIGDNLDFATSVKFGDFTVSGYNIVRIS